MRTSVMAETLITAPGRMLSQEWARELHHEPGARRRRRLRDGDCRARQGRLRAPLPGRRHRGARRTRSLRTGLGTGRQRVARRRVAAPGTGRRARLPQRRSARGLAGHAAHPDARMGPEAARRHRRGRGTAGSRTALVRSPLDRRAGAARRPDAGARVRGRAGKDRGGAVLDSLARRGRRETGEGARRLLGLCNRARDERIDVHGADRRLDRRGLRRVPGVRGRLALGPAARRRAGARAANARRRRRGGRSEGLRRAAPRPRRADHGLRPSRLPRRGSAGASPAPHRDRARLAARRGRRSSRAGGDRRVAREISGPPARDERRVLGCDRARDRAHSGGDHARALRVRAHRRLVGAHRRAEADRPVDPPERDLRRPGREAPVGALTEALDRAHELLATWREEVRRELPPDVEIFDAHVHLGNDIDGMAGRPDELLAMMDEYGVERAFMFCLDEPDRHPGFRAPNDRTLAYAEQSGGRLIPFVRLDLTENPVEEAIRCLDAGARGIKLHPRAQKISLQDERLPPVFELAAERKVPILIHGGRGMPPIAAHLHSLVDRCDGVQLIVAHAGIADMANLTSSFAGMPGVFFDTSTWSAIDLLDFYRQMPPEQIVYASDYPYGRQPNSLLMAMRTARLAGFAEDDIRNLLGRNARRIADGESPLEPSKPLGGDELTQPTILARIHQYLSMATPLMWTRQPDTLGVLGLALNTCDSPSNGYRKQTEQIRELIATAQVLWVAALEEHEESERIRSSRFVSRLIHLADIVAVTAREH